MSDDQRANREAGPQPDPMLRPGRIKPIWIWTIGAVCVVAVVLLLIAISPPVPNIAEQSPRGLPTGTSAAPQSTMPAGRTTSDAPLTPPVTTQGASPQSGTTGSSQQD
jgi:hypothetical protein